MNTENRKDYLFFCLGQLWTTAVEIVAAVQQWVDQETAYQVKWLLHHTVSVSSNRSIIENQDY